jgi:hypothetical protein
MPRSHRSPLIPAILAAVAIIVLLALLFGCGESEHVAVPQSLAEMTSPAENDIDKLDNLISRGLVGRIDHNDGTVRVDAAKWSRLSAADRDDVIRLVSLELGRMPQVEVMP